MYLKYSLGPVLTNNNAGGGGNWNESQRMSRKIRYGSRNVNNNQRNVSNANYDSNNSSNHNGLIAINGMTNNNNIPAIKAPLQATHVSILIII